MTFFFFNSRTVYSSITSRFHELALLFFFQTDEVFLEAQIQNITTSPMFMEKVSLEPSMMYNVAELNTVDTAGERYVQIQDICL